MKNSTPIPVLIILFLAIIMFAFVTNKPIRSESPQMPENVKAIVDNKCFGCHNTGSKNDDAKEKLDYKKLDGLSVIKKISAYKDISEELEKDEMPPKKFLKQHPEKKLTEEEKKVLIEWADKEAEKLVKNMQ